MCDYCDCRSHAEIAALSGEHDRLLGLLADLRRARAAGDVGGVEAAADALHTILDAHAAREERGIFAQLRDDVGDSYIEVFVGDHERIHPLVDATRAGDCEAAARLVDALSAHIACEESDLFPAAHQLLSPRQWDAVVMAGRQ